jgi:hypothetical protein
MKIHSESRVTGRLILWAIGLSCGIALGLMPGFPSLPPGMDKILHAGGLLALMIGPILCCERARYVILMAVLLIMCGALVEILQRFIPGREGSVDDFLADLAGVGAGLMVWGMSSTRAVEMILPARVVAS